MAPDPSELIVVSHPRSLPAALRQVIEQRQANRLGGSIAVVGRSTVAARLLLRDVARHTTLVGVRSYDARTFFNSVAKLEPTFREPSVSRRLEAIRIALTRHTGPYAGVAHHRSTEEAIDTMLQTLQSLSISDRHAWAATDPRFGETLPLLEEIEGVLQLGPTRTATHVATDLLRDSPERTQIFGHIVWVEPELRDPLILNAVRCTVQQGDATVLAAGLDHPGYNEQLTERLRGVGPVRLVDIQEPFPIDIRLVCVPDPIDEVRTAIAEMKLALQHDPSARVGIVLAQSDPYERLVHELLDAESIPWTGRRRLLLAETAVGRHVRGLLDLASPGSPPFLNRADVAAWLTGAPVLSPQSGDLVPGSQWDGVTRRAGIVGGYDQWTSRLTRHRGTQLRIAEHPDSSPEEQAVALDEAQRCQAILAFAAQLLRDLQAPSRGTWATFAGWLSRLLATYLPPLDQHPSTESDSVALDAVTALLDTARRLDDLGGRIDLQVFQRAVERTLDARAGRHGQLEHGVGVFALSETVGVSFDVAVLVGMAEGFLPQRVAEAATWLEPPALSPQRQRDARDSQLDSAFWLAYASKAFIGTVPAADLRSRRELTPSRVALALAEQLVGRNVLSSELTGLAQSDTQLVTVQPSFAASIADKSFVLARREWLASALVGQPTLDNPILGLSAQLRNGAAAVVARSQVDTLTPFTGLVTELANFSPRSGAVLSATALEKWAGCPRRSMLERGMGLEPVEVPEDILEISPSDRGTLIHTILERFHNEGYLDPVQPVADDARLALLRDIAHQEFATLEQLGVTGRPLAWELAKLRIERELQRFETADRAVRDITGQRPIATELVFGRGDAAPFVRALPSGGELRLRGMIDRVDASNAQVTVYDYKTGSFSSYLDIENDIVAGGTHLQLPVYALAAAAQLGRPVAQAYFWFCSTRGEQRLIGAQLSQESYDRLDHVLDVMVTSIEAGFFPPRPNRCEYCDVAMACGQRRETEWQHVQLDPRLQPYIDTCLTKQTPPQSSPAPVPA